MLRTIRYKASGELRRSLPVHPFSFMTSSSVKAIQDKLFRGGDDSNGPGSSDSDPRDHRLTIQIPKPTASRSEPPQKAAKASPRSGVSGLDGDAIQKSYRQRLSDRLGANYQGVERYRLQQDDARLRHWKRWGPYLSDRQWVRIIQQRHPCFDSTHQLLQATVREDYSDNGDAWSHFPHEHARSRAYRWGEDGIGGISDNHQRLCFSLSLWNGEDRMLKERLFGVTGHQGNHGEDVKELYYYLDSSPSHSYMKFLYKYPQRKYPYEDLVTENVHRDRNVTEYEILDSDAFEDDRYWDVFMEVSVVCSRSGPVDWTIFRSTQKMKTTRTVSMYGSPVTIAARNLQRSISFLNCGSAIHGHGPL